MAHEAGAEGAHDVPSGGAHAPGDPRISAVACLPSKALPCRGRGVLLHERRFVVRGTELAGVDSLTFEGRRGRRDDLEAQLTRVTESRLVGVVPDRARTGRLRLERDGGGRVRTDAVRVRASAPPPTAAEPGSRFFFDARRKPELSFEVSQAVEAEVGVVDIATGEQLETLSVAAAPGQAAVVRWDGRDARDAPAPAGDYELRLLGDAQTAATGGETVAAFAFGDHLFPIRGRHNLGYTDTNDFGGSRDHKGQDMFAKCGTPLAAARGGRVKYAGYQAAAGNYVVIDGAGTGVDYVYMHMRSAPRVQTGQRVFTGQPLGEVGETGRASGCHLHFELWSAPGWYDGGQPFDPLPQLRAWDAAS
jgi:murein DD-endopeptidase MepM/ murein hydrolase activator NlpD